MARYPYAVDDWALIRTSRLNLFTPSDSSPATTMLKFKLLKNQPTAVEVSPPELGYLPSCGLCFTTILSKALTPSYRGRRFYNESRQLQPAWCRSSETSLHITRLQNVATNRCAPSERMSSRAPSIVHVYSQSLRAIASLSPLLYPARICSSPRSLHLASSDIEQDSGTFRIRPALLLPS